MSSENTAQRVALWELDSPEQVFALGQTVARSLKGGEILALSGPLGAGKTLFTKGLAKGLGIPPDDVVSPTFILMGLYEGRLPLLHADAYRLDDPGELERLGWDQWANEGVRVVEWAERVLPALEGRPVRWYRFEVPEPGRRRITEWTGFPEIDTVGPS